METYFVTTAYVGVILIKSVSVLIWWHWYIVFASVISCLSLFFPGCPQSSSRTWCRCSPPLQNSCRCWVLQCSGKHCPRVVKRRTSLSWTATLPLCCSLRCSRFKARTQNRKDKGAWPNSFCVFLRPDQRTTCPICALSSSAAWRFGRLTVRLRRSCTPFRLSTASSHIAQNASLQVMMTPQLSACLRLKYDTPPPSPPDHVILLSKKLVDWLRYASIMQVGGASSGGFFSGSRSRQVSTLHVVRNQWVSKSVTCLCVISRRPSQSWTGRCRGISSRCCAWGRDSLRTSGWTSIPSLCCATGFSPTAGFPTTAW